LLTYCLIVRHHPHRSVSPPASLLPYSPKALFPLSLFFATLPKNQPVSLIIAAHPKWPSCKSFVCHTCETPEKQTRYSWEVLTESAFHFTVQLGIWLCV